MSFFENFAEKAKLYANIAADKAKDVAEVAADKAKDVKETAQLNMAIRNEQRELEKNYRAIGQWFASEFEGEVPEAIKDVMEAIKASRTKIEEMEAVLAEKPHTEIEITIEKESDLKTCPVCGTATNTRFCPECGAEIVVPAPVEEPVAEECAAEECAAPETPAETQE